MPIGNSHDVISNIVAGLFAAEERRLEKIIETLGQQNKECFPDKPHDGFTYQGKPYFPGTLTRGARTWVPLHFSLVDQMDDYLKDKEKVWTDRHFISQMLFSVLQPCDNMQDLRDALPDCIADTLPNLKTYLRTNEEAFTIRNNSQLYRQYKKILPRIEFYATTRLIY